LETHLIPGSPDLIFHSLGDVPACWKDER